MSCRSLRMGPSRSHNQCPQFPQTVPIDEVRSRQCPLLWTWVLEKMRMLKFVERLTNKKHRDTRFTQVQALGGKYPTPSCLLLIMAKPKITGVRRCNLAWRCICGVEGLGRV